MILTYYIAFTMLLIAYLLGSIPSAVWIGKKYYGIDIREYGSKNAGTTNMLRVLGRRAALPVFALDVLKGFVAVTIVDLIKYDDFFAGTANDNWFYILRFAAIFAALLGHIFPVFAGFRGGKGVATLVGGVIAVVVGGEHVAPHLHGLSLWMAVAITLLVAISANSVSVNISRKLFRRGLRA